MHPILFLFSNSSLTDLLERTGLMNYKRLGYVYQIHLSMGFQITLGLYDTHNSNPTVQSAVQPTECDVFISREI